MLIEFPGKCHIMLEIVQKGGAKKGLKCLKKYHNTLTRLSSGSPRICGGQEICTVRYMARIEAKSILNFRKCQ